MSDIQPPTTTVTTGIGRLRGAVDTGIRRFLGIPYAQPPVGERRFALPEPVGPWSGTREALQHGPTAPQHPYVGAMGRLLTTVEIPGDDILTLNVWTPVDVPAAGLPVMVWYHGGALERGTAALPSYDGATFARDGVVFVSVNYRLGAEGFSVLQGAPRNLGLSDAALGLAWVHREIAAFGGDPARITIVGESAGGAIVAALLMRPDAVGFIAGAIIESGPLEVEAPERAARVTRDLAKRLGIPPTRDAFAEISPEVLLETRRAQAAGGSPLGGTSAYVLALDHDSLPRSPHEELASLDVPIMIGTNTDEYRLWFAPAALARISAAKLLAGRLALRIPGRAVRAYRHAWPEATSGELFGQIATDRLLRAPAIRVADQRTAPTFVYEFAWESPVRDLRAAHALEIGFVFDRVDEPESVLLAGPNAPRSLVERMHGDWVRFISDGDPGWPTYGDERLVQIFDETARVEPLRRAEAVDALIG